MFDDTRGNGGGGDDGDDWRDWHRRPHHYILDGQTVKPAGLMTWARWYKTADRVIARRVFKGLCVSTVFVGLDMAITGPPMLFETAVFIGWRKGGLIADCWRAATWTEAVGLHREALALAQTARHARALARQPWDIREGLRGLYGRRNRSEGS